ncbi:GNAT family N-acetyltransferase [Kitasatospora sp. NPDC002227]|uniref:GNAT family N-acetyltransferase n=1 Tax=Kitasatospora sp. NPDC002227 TaxID=3154773 RepID=UPI00331F0904
MSQTAEEPVTVVRPPEQFSLPGGVSLRRRAVEDAVPLNNAVAGNLEHLRPWMPWATSKPALERTEAMIQAGIDAWEAGTDFMYLVWAEDAPGEVIGAFGLHGRVGAGALEIGYWMAASHTGRGIATDCSRVLTEAALALPHIERVEIHTDSANLASSAVPRKLGYRLAEVREQEPTAPGESGSLQIWTQQQ